MRFARLAATWLPSSSADRAQSPTYGREVYVRGSYTVASCFALATAMTTFAAPAYAQQPPTRVTEGPRGARGRCRGHLRRPRLQRSGRLLGHWRAGDRGDSREPSGGNSQHCAGRQRSDELGARAAGGDPVASVAGGRGAGLVPDPRERHSDAGPGFRQRQRSSKCITRQPKRSRLCAGRVRFAMVRTLSTV